MVTTKCCFHVHKTLFNPTKYAVQLSAENFWDQEKTDKVMVQITTTTKKEA
jgi:hypothetical protein